MKNWIFANIQFFNNYQVFCLILNANGGTFSKQIVLPIFSLKTNILLYNIKKFNFCKLVKSAKLSLTLNLNLNLGFYIRNRLKQFSLTVLTRFESLTRFNLKIIEKLDIREYPIF